MSHQPLPPKKDVALALLERSTVFVHLDPRDDTAIVPPWFKKQPQLVLQIGLNMAVAIPDLRVDEAGLSCTLSFNRSPFHCVVPWGRVFALLGDDGRGMVWPDDLPAELARPAPPPRPQVALAPAPEEAPAKAKKGPAKRGKRAEAAASPAPAAEGAAPRGPRAVPPPAETEEEAKAKKAQKKPRIVPPPPPEARGPLVAVPSPPPPGRRPSARGKSKKREIPPYLRVVK